MTTRHLSIDKRHSVERDKMKKEKKVKKTVASNINDVINNDTTIKDQVKTKMKREEKKNRLEHDDDDKKIKKGKKRIRTDEGKGGQNEDVSEEANTLKANSDIKHINSDISEPHNAGTESSSLSSVPRPLVESSALPPNRLDSKSSEEIEDEQYPISLLLFYQYVSPLWNDVTYKLVQEDIERIGTSLHVHGRIRVAKEGLNSTLSGSKQNVQQFCYKLRQWKPDIFHQTEFKITHHLENKYHFPSLKIIPVLELVHYGLDGKSIATVPPPTVLEQYSGTHLEPMEYHQKLAEPNTVVIDVRNHYEAAIGHFDLPTSSATTTADIENDTSSKFLDPKMRKSTEFPIWLDHPSTKEQLKGKQVLMYCTGGIRCERASALLQYKIQNDPTVQALNIKGVYQLQGGIDKYFKQFPDGGYWVGKNYTFDKRCAHTPVETEVVVDKDQNGKEVKVSAPLGKCAACLKSWDNYGGKPCRCPTCGVPNLICKDCFNNKKKKIKTIRCDLCVEQNVLSKKELRDKERQELIEFEQRNESLVTQHQEISGVTTKTSVAVSSSSSSSSSLLLKNNSNNPDGTTRLFLRNMCRNSVTEEKIMEVLPNVTHIVWKVDGKSGKFFGQGWVEMESVHAAENAVLQSGKLIVCGRPLYIEFQPPDGKDLWPPPRSAVSKK